MPPKQWTEEALKACYETIKSQVEVQHENYSNFLKQAGQDQLTTWKRLADDLGVELNVDSGRIRYKDSFKPLDLQVEICYIRHGKTEGNTEPRVYQGMVDYPSNQLNRIGEEQAVAAAERMEHFVQEGRWGLPDLIVSSPLQRAQNTAKPYREKHWDMPYRVLPEVAEMRFGSWDNQKVAELPPENICHLFYLEQNVLVKSAEPHRVNLDTWVRPEWLNGQTLIEGENFLECLQRQREALWKVEAVAKEVSQEITSKDARKPRVVIYGHSMAGAALSTLLGHAKKDSSGWLCFDGNYIMPNATPTLLIPEDKQQRD